MKIPDSVSLNKLSKLQQMILVMLLEPRYSTWKRPRLRAMIKILWHGRPEAKVKATNMAAILSRSLTSLEERGLIVRTRPGSWKLTIWQNLGNGSDGLTFAFLAWGRDREFYAQRLGLRGPDREMLGLTTTPASSSPPLSEAAPRKGVPEPELIL